MYNFKIIYMYDLVSLQRLVALILPLKAQKASLYTRRCHSRAGAVTAPVRAARILCMKPPGAHAEATSFSGFFEQRETAMVFLLTTAASSVRQT
jgi:hypothetical protein